MTIFNKIISTEDAKEFCKLSKNAKIEWIKKFTNQQDDGLILEFLNSSPQIASEKGCGCNHAKEHLKEIEVVSPEYLSKKFYIKKKNS